jgi:2,4-dienoyl-CoA reductase-like NADH-dependent reductase (Old Yellow Enzyme family)
LEELRQGYDEIAPQSLLTPFRMGDLMLPNRVVMAPLTRQRAANSGHVPTKLQALSTLQE